MRDEGNVETYNWTHDDNMKSQSKGWIISNADGSEIPELYSLVRGRSPNYIYEMLLKPYSQDGGLEAKACVALVGLKMRHPNHRFLFEHRPDTPHSKDS